jgi:hypothetical protein
VNMGTVWDLTLGPRIRRGLGVGRIDR